MKTGKFIILLTVVLVSFITACDVVEPPYVKYNPVDAKTKLLLEDYTGHDCVNCPSAALKAHDLKEEYEDDLVIIAVHAGWFARPIPQEPSLASDFRCDAGEAWYDFFKAFANPVGMVNRIESSPGDYLIDWEEWELAVKHELQKEPEAGLTIENTFDESTRKLETTITTQFITAQTDQFNLIVCVTQDSIIDGQKNNNSDIGPALIEDYVFMHMLRGSLNGDWGKLLTDDDPVKVGQDYTKTISYTFPEEWIEKDCHVVAFIYSAQTLTILQVEEAAVLE